MSRSVARISRKTKIVDNGRLQYLRSCSFEMYVNEVFVIRCLYTAMSLTLVREQRFIRIFSFFLFFFFLSGVCLN